MTDFNTHTLDSVPEAGREALETVNAKYGFVPNLLATMVESPAVAQAYLGIGDAFGNTSFTETERQVVLLTVSRIHECEYCVAAHTAISQMAKVPGDVVDAIRNDTPIAEVRLQALRDFTTAIVQKRGWADEADVASFLEAGYTRAQVLEAILGIAMKTLSNFTNHIAKTPLDAAFQPAEWHAPSPQVA